ncbi:MFS transporter [Salinicola avicenniae]|uniref:MFS transporter n=1 Tax=Salinicola avicenniae TaxID=2916836 RepID=UPI00207395B2|nr:MULTISPECIES: MFS transporter [unclassified Salinicola]
MTRSHAVAGISPTRHLIVLTVSLFLSYLCVALSLPVVSVYVNQHLGLGDTLGGLAVGITFLATILTRNLAGRLSDRYGGRHAMFRGLALYALASLVCLASSLVSATPLLAYAGLLVGRLLLGLGESLTIIGMVSWGMGLGGPARSGRVLSLMGMGMYGAFVVGGPLGLALYHQFSFAGLMGLAGLLPLLGALLVRSVPADTPVAGERQSFWRLIGRIWKPGAAVGLQGVGFAALGAFISLYFLDEGWPWAGWGLSGFGLGYVLVRLLCGHLPDRLGGTRVAMVSLAVEACGQALLWQATGPGMALVGAFLTGLGCSMVFPAMGLEAVRRVPASQRGTAMGGFAAFQDVAYGATGPVAGLFAGAFGYANIFLLGLLAALLGLWVAWLAHRDTPGEGG